MLDFRIDTFLAAARHLNFTRAAEELNITQPAVSQHIRILEEEYGVKLFRSEGKKIRLTEEGEVFLNAAVTMKHDTIHLKENLGTVRGHRKRMIFGATLTVAEYILPGTLADILRGNGNHTFQMTVANTKELLKQLDEGVIDFALVEGYFERRAYDYLIYSKERYIAASGKDKRWEGSVGIRDLLKEHLIIREPGSGSREILEKYLAEKNLSTADFSQVTEIGNISAIKVLTEANCGITFLYEAAVREELKQGKLLEIKTEDFHVTHDIAFIWRKNSIFKEEYGKIFRMFQPKGRQHFDSLTQHK